MNAVFHCPSCNAPLGTLENPTPDPLPACRDCGWMPLPSATGPGSKAGKLLLAVVFAVVGWAAGLFTAHSLFFVIVALVVFGPATAFGIGRTSARGWFLFNLCYFSGFVAGILGVRDGETFGPNGWQLPVLVAVGSLLLGWLIGWLKHAE